LHGDNLIDDSTVKNRKGGGKNCGERPWICLDEGLKAINRELNAEKSTYWTDTYILKPNS
jgi:hypothetical protein